MKYTAFVIALGLVLFVLGVRVAVALDADVYRLRVVTIEFTWVAVLVFLAILSSVAIFGKRLPLRWLTAALAVGGITLYLWMYDAILPW